MIKKMKEQKQLKILCLEDNLNNVNLIQNILRESGYESQINYVNSESRFLSALTQSDYDVIISNCELKSFDISSIIRSANSQCPEIPFICLSNSKEEGKSKDFLKWGAAEFILNNDINRLPTVVHRIMDTKDSKKTINEPEKNLKETDHQFRSFVENAFDAMYLMRGKHYEYVNPMFSKLTGYSIDELTSKDFTYERLLTESSLKIVNKRFEDRMKGINIPNQYESQIKTKDGRILDVEIGTVTLGSKDNVIVLGMIHDLTKRKQAERALMKAHKLLNETQAISRIGGWSYDVATKTGVWTDEVYKIHGVGKDFNPDDMDTIISFYAPEEMPILYKAFRNAVENGVPFDLELELIKANGKRIWVRTIGRPHIKDGKVDRISGNIMDISERKEAEKKLVALTTRQDAILSAVPDIIMEVDNNKKYTWANKAGLDFFGEDVVGKEANEFFMDNLDIYGQVNPIFDGDAHTIYVENWQKRKDGERRLLAWWCKGLKNEDGKIIGALSSARDITESRKSELLIGHLNRVLLSIRDINKTIINERDAEKIIQKTCDILVQRRGYGKVMIILVDESKKPILWAQKGFANAFTAIEEDLKNGKLPPCCKDSLYKNTTSFLSDQETVCNDCQVIEFFPDNQGLCTRIRYDDRIYGYLTVSLPAEQTIDEEEQSLFTELANDVAFAMHNIEQVKAKKQAEMERDRIEAELRQSQKMEAVGLLAGGIAHDFNNMLTVIIGYTELALASLNADDPLHRNFIEIQAASQRSTNIIRQLLAFSRKQLIAPEAVMLNEYISDILRMLSRLIGEDIELKFLPSEDLWNIWMDPSQISQILTNLAVNARDAISDVGSVSIETSNVVLDEAYQNVHKYIIPGDYVLLAFSDNGKGISRDIADRIFEPFFTTKDSGKGTGLGLSTVYGIVKQNNGYIHVYSELGLGTTFKIYFPRYRGAVEVPQEKPKPGITKGTETILIVEDYEEILYLAVEILEQQGYKMLRARNPEEAVMTAMQYHGDIHLLITDVVLPTMNGKDLEKKIKTTRPDLKTLFMSGYTADIITQRGVIEQGVSFLQKPFTIQSLASKVREVLDS